ncbi:hypothetical protein OBBRIDRAFT_244858 [Obba rivulosa]|uniref:Uncharacterized protein n=1 Tax=Obba rivulosa TaxID=1052685 RepID=A0A8E2AN48_9APHY|nr:hypothetical protein OBBRIDRAFT_244858 [Obba rivulosa]
MMSTILRSSNAHTGSLALIRQHHSLVVIATSPASNMCHEWPGFFNSRFNLPTLADLLPDAPILEFWVCGYRSFTPSTLARSVNEEWIDGIPDLAETIWVNEELLGPVLAALKVQPHVSAIPCRALNTLHIIVNHGRRDFHARLSQTIPLLINIASRRADLGFPFKRVVFDSVGKHGSERLRLHGIDALSKVVEAVEYEKRTERPILQMPSICVTGDHDWWPSWTNTWDRQDMGDYSDGNLTDWYDGEHDDDEGDDDDDEHGDDEYGW